MEKNLLSIDHLHDGVCSAVADVESERERDMLSASLLSLMSRDEMVATAVCSAAVTFIRQKDECRKVADEAIAAVRKKQS